MSMERPQFQETPEERRFINPEDYLKRKALEEGNVPEDILRASLDRLNKPLQKIDYEENGSAEVVTDQGQFGFSYSPPDEELKTKIDRYVQYISRGANSEASYTKADNWRKLDKLVFEIEDQQKDVLASLPEKYKVVFCPTTEYFHGAVSDGCIYILGDITTPRSIITLLHEMGHVFDDANLEEKDIITPMKHGWHTNTAEKVRRERAASAFALKRLRPFFKDAQFKEDAINFLKNYALESYNRTTREQYQQTEAEIPVLEKRARQAQGDWEVEQREMERYRLYDDFMEWQRTDAYKEWKEKEEIKKLEDYEEFSYWEEWVKNTGYDYKKDLPKKKLEN